jgi:hypothetical protein
MEKKRGFTGLLKRYGFELLVVFVGVWLSLLAESSRQNQILRSAEKESLARLVKDIDDDLSDMRGNLVRAEAGLDGALWALEARAADHVPSAELALKLAQMGPCSNLGENTSEYVSLKSSGNLNNISDELLRQEIVKLYEGRSFLRWWHALDCSESEAVLDLLGRHVEFGVPSVERESPDSVEWHLRRHPSIQSIPNLQSVFDDLELMNRITRLASMRQALKQAISEEIVRTQDLQVRVRDSAGG